jgi:hypothetical protein
MLIPEGFAQVNLIFAGEAVPTGAQITMGLNLEGGGQTPTEVGEEYADLWRAAGISANMSSQVDLAQVLVKFGPNATGPSALLAETDGGSLTAPCTPNVAFLVRKSTAAGGRAGRGRFYLPGVVEAQVDGAGTIDSITITNLQADLNTFLSSFGAASFSPVLLHGDGAPITEPLLINALTLDAKVATQRRRLRR